MSESRGYSCEQSPHPHPGQLEDTEEKQVNDKVYNKIEKINQGQRAKRKAWGRGVFRWWFGKASLRRGPLGEAGESEEKAVGTPGEGTALHT